MPTVSDILDSMEYGPSPEQNSHVKDWLARHADGFGHFINGSFVGSSGRAWVEVDNPA
ncbi:MAG: hypothetical protein GYA66_07770, partial [Phyllobacteriaceae bacterium]|nr:hypothetical protein [Phyllobacteriaceae bacterium]